MGSQLFLVPDPLKLEFSGKWYKFDGFNNLPDFLAKVYQLKKGSWDIRKIKRDGQGVSVSEGLVEIWGDKGTSYASLIQLAKNKPGFLPEATFEEPTDFKFRGFHLDIARGGVPNEKAFEQILKWLFLLKYNKFGIYFEDLFPWKGKKEIGKSRGRLTDLEWKHILEIGAKLGIDIFPSLELLGHMEHFLKIPKYNKFSELWWMGYDCLDLSNKEARKFAVSLLEDAIDKSSSKLINLGGDETWVLGRGRSLDKLHKYMGPDLYLDHYRELVHTSLRKGKIPMLWGDMLTGMYLTSDGRGSWAKVVKDSLWNEVLIANWDYEPLERDHFISKIREIGHKNKQIACPALHNWSTFYPDFEPAIKNVTSFLEAARSEHLEGYMITAWGDAGQECLLSFLYPLILTSADFSANQDSWLIKYSLFSGESLDLAKIRFSAGNASVGPAIRNVLYSPLNFLTHRRELPQDWKLKMKQFYEQVKDKRLPPDLELIRKMVYNSLNLNNKIFDEESYLDMVHKYEQAWLNERKFNGLENVVSRLMGTYEAKRLGF